MRTNGKCVARFMCFHCKGSFFLTDLVMEGQQALCPNCFTQGGLSKVLQALEGTIDAEYLQHLAKTAAKAKNGGWLLANRFARLIRREASE